MTLWDLTYWVCALIAVAAFSILVALLLKPAAKPLLLPAWVDGEPDPPDETPREMWDWPRLPDSARYWWER